MLKNWEKPLEYTALASMPPQQPQLLLVKQLQGACSDCTRVKRDTELDQKNTRRENVGVRDHRYKVCKANHLGKHMILWAVTEEPVDTASKFILTSVHGLGMKQGQSHKEMLYLQYNKAGKTRVEYLLQTTMLLFHQTEKA